MTVVQDVYPLTPMQRLYWLATACRPTASVAQFRYALNGPLDCHAFADAWTAVVNRHPALRSALTSDDADEPLQFVLATVEPEFRIVEAPADDSARTVWEESEDAHQRRAFDLSQPPLMRFALLRRDEGSWLFIWTFYRGLIDGWSVGLIWNEVWRVYEAKVSGREPNLTQVRDFRDYLAWIQTRPAGAAEQFWRTKLSDLESVGSNAGFAATRGAVRAEGETRTLGRERMTLSGPTNRLLRQAALDAGATPNALISTLWALAMTAGAAGRPVVMGATVSGRPADLPGAETIVGMFTNNVPIPVSPVASRTLESLVHQMHQSLLDVRMHEYVGLDSLEQWAGNRKLVDNLVVFLDLDSARTVATGAGQVKVTDLNEPLHTGYPLTLLCQPDRGEFLLDYEAGRVSRDTALALIENLRHLIDVAIEFPFDRLDAVLSRLPHPVQPQTAVQRLTRPAAPRPDSAGKAPVSATETRLLALFRRVLGMDDVAPDDDFFALGGTSIMAARMFGDIAREFNRRLPLGILFRGATPAFLAAQLDAMSTPVRPAVEREHAADPCVVAIREGAVRAPFFLLHGISGEVLAYRPLATHLDAAQPVFGIQAEDLDRDDVTPITLEAVAGRCVLAIQSVQPSGPYRLGGHCAGGLLAFEVARQLADRGHLVAMVAIIDYDMSAPAERPALDVVLDMGRNLPRWVVDDGLPSGPGELAGRLRSKTRALTMRAVGRLTGETKAREDVRDRLGMWHFPDRSVPRLERDERTFLEYVPKPYDGRVVVYRPRTIRLLGRQPDDDLGWAPFARSGVEVRVVSGSHGTMLQAPAVAHLAAAIQRDLDEAVRASGSQDSQQPRTA